MKSYRPVLEALEDRLVPTALNLHPVEFAAHHHGKPATNPTLTSVDITLNGAVISGTTFTETEGAPFLFVAVPTLSNGAVLPASQIASVLWVSSDPNVVFVSPTGTQQGTQFVTAEVGLADTGGTATVTVTVTSLTGATVTSAPVTIQVNPKV